MNNEKIIEIALRYGCLELCNSRWLFSENGLRKFARVLIEEDRKTVDDEPFLWVETDKHGELNRDVTCMFSGSPAFIEHLLPLYRRPQRKQCMSEET